MRSCKLGPECPTQVGDRCEVSGCDYARGANTYQVGGSHYKTGYEHWDWAHDLRLQYLEGTATKYIARWRRKEGLQDLQKALHYVNKLIEVSEDADEQWSVEEIGDRYNVTTAFATANDLGETELVILKILACWDSIAELEEARDLLLKLFDQAEAKPVPLTEENHYTDRSTDPMGR